MRIYINDGFDGNITYYPEHIFEWKVSGVNCPTEDYTVGNISQPILTFRTDVDIPLNNVVQTMANGNDWIYWKVTDKVKNNNSMGQAVSYSITALPLLPFDLDGAVPDSILQSYTENDTLSSIWNKTAHLLNGIGTYTNPISVNANYIVGNKWWNTGLTYRQILSWCAQLAGINVSCMAQYLPENDDAHTPFYQCTTFEPGNLNNVDLHFTPSNVKSAVVSDYIVPQVDKIWFGVNETDVGMTYGSGSNQMSLSANPMINPEDDSFLQPLYNKIHSLDPYYPVKINTFSQAENILTDFVNLAWLSSMAMDYTVDNNVYTTPIFNWEISQDGITLEGTGNQDRGAANQEVSNQIASAGKYNTLRRTLDETVSEVGTLNGEYSQLAQTVDGITVTVAGLSTKASTISTDTIYYLATSASSGVTTSTAGWTTTPQSMTATNQYLWTYHKYTYADNHTTDSTPVITGRYGQNGTSGVGITSVTSLYYAKANSTAPAKPTAHVTSTSTAGGAWRVAVPTLSSSYPYMFTCDEILYTDNHYDWTEVVQNTALTNFNSRIEQNASDISLKVSQSDYNGNTIASLINQTATTVTINAQHINLAGAVSFSDLDSSAQAAINDKTDASEVTQIIGNTVNASYINALEINAKKIVSTYTITWNHNNYSQADLTAINNIITSDSGYTDSDLEKYDFNLDGTINISDFVICRNMINNGTDYTASIKTEIDPSIPSRPIAIYSGNTLKSYLSPGRAMAPAGLFNSVVTGNNSKLTADDLYLYRNSTEKALINTTYIHMGDLDNSTGKRLNIYINNGIYFVNSS